MHGHFGQADLPVKIKQGWEDAGKRGTFFCWVQNHGGQRWAVVQWDGDDDPSLFKAAGLLILYGTRWSDLVKL